MDIFIMINDDDDDDDDVVEESDAIIQIHELVRSSGI